MKIQIVDASVAVKWFLKEKLTEQALLVLNKIIENPEKFAVPELFFYETGNALGRLADFGRDEQKQYYRKQMHFLHSLGLHRIPLTESAFEDWILAQETGLTAYDAAYWALARELGGQWITCDKKAFNLIKPIDKAKAVLLVE